MDKLLAILDSMREQGHIIFDPKSKAELIYPIKGLNGGYLYELFPGLSPESIYTLVKSYKRTIPTEFLKFLSLTNGANLFGKSLRISGMMYSPIEYKNCKVPDPLQYTDIHRTPKTPKSWLFFAVYTQWESDMMAHVCFDCSTDTTNPPVYCVKYDSDDILCEWPSFYDWFYQEYNRYKVKFYNGQYEIQDIVKDVVRRISFF